MSSLRQTLRWNKRGSRKPSPTQRYEALKQQRIVANPEATPVQYQQAMTQIAKVCGI